MSGASCGPLLGGQRRGGCLLPTLNHTTLEDTVSRFTLEHRISAGSKQTCIFGCTCMYIKDCKGWWLSSGRSSVFRTLPAQARNPGFVKETNLLKYIFDGTQVKNWLSLNI